MLFKINPKIFKFNMEMKTTSRSLSAKDYLTWILPRQVDQTGLAASRQRADTNKSFMMTGDTRRAPAFIIKLIRLSCWLSLSSMNYSSFISV